MAAAPFAAAALWATAVGAAFLVWAVTGDQAPLDWLRSGNGLLAAAALSAGGLLAASLCGRRWAPKPRVAPAMEPRSFSGWLLDEGRFDSA